MRLSTDLETRLSVDRPDPQHLLPQRVNHSVEIRCSIKIFPICRKLWTIFRWVRRRAKLWLLAANGLFRCLTKLLTIENAHAPNTMNSMGKITIDLAAKISKISHFPSVHNPDSCSNFFPTQISVFWVDSKFLVALKRCSNFVSFRNFSHMSIIWTRQKNSIFCLIRKKFYHCRNAEK